MRRLFLAISLIVVISQYANSAVVVKETSNSGGIHASGDAGSGDGQYTEFYASGNDDAFAEYGILGFTYSAADFGLASVTAGDITGVSLALTVNDRSFSDGDSIEFFFTTDTFASLGDGATYSNLAYNDTLTNGLDFSQFTAAPISLGVYSIAEMAGRAGGEVDTFNLAFSGTSLDGLVSSINAGTDFQIIGAATAASFDITYSGFGNGFDPGNPALTINSVPEPSSLALLGLAASGLVVRRRRASNLGTYHID